VNENLQYKEGLLKMVFSDKKTYEGMIRDYRKHRLGKMTWHIGDCYVGEWENDGMHGPGMVNRS